MQKYLVLRCGQIRRVYKVVAIVSRAVFVRFYKQSLFNEGEKVTKHENNS